MFRVIKAWIIMIGNRHLRQRGIAHLPRTGKQYIFTMEIMLVKGNDMKAHLDRLGMSLQELEHIRFHFHRVQGCFAVRPPYVIEGGLLSESPLYPRQWLCSRVVLVYPAAVFLSEEVRRKE